MPGYAVADLVGAGGSGQVWAATSLATGGPVAVKVLPPESLAPGADPGADPGEALRELATLTAVGGDHIMSVHEAMLLGDGSLAIVMDLMTGGSLATLVRHRGHLSAGETVTVLAPVAAALAALHREGVVHGDVAPGNVLLDRSGRPRVSDLGTALVRGEVPDEVRGTSGFVAPEVLLGADPGTASDVYGVGALGWLCLTGRAPAPGPLRGALADQVEHLGAGAAELVKVLTEALWADPERRPGASALAVAIFDAAEAEPLHLTHPGDDVSVVTRRIRTAARESADDAATGQRRGGRGVQGRPRGRAGHGRARGHDGQGRPRGRHTSSGRGASRRGARPVGLAGLAALAVALMAGAWWIGRPESAASADRAVAAGPAAAVSSHPAETPAASAAAASTAPAVIAAEAADPRLDPRAPSTDPRALVQALADARARAWVTGVAARLNEADAPRSAAMREDAAALAGVQRAGRRYVGLRFTVAKARLEQMSLQRTTIRTRVDASAYAVVGRTSREERPAKVGEEVLLEVVWTEAGWRVSAVRAG